MMEIWKEIKKFTSTQGYGHKQKGKGFTVCGHLCFDFLMECIKLLSVHIHRQQRGLTYTWNMQQNFHKVNLGKVKSLDLTKYHAMKTYEGVEV
jgi:hypothetical protein